MERGVGGKGGVNETRKCSPQKIWIPRFFSLPSILHLVSIPTPDDFLPSILSSTPSQSRHIVFWQVIPWMDFLLLLYRSAQWILMSQKNFSPSISLSHNIFVRKSFLYSPFQCLKLREMKMTQFPSDLMCCWAKILLVRGDLVSGICWKVLFAWRILEFTVRKLAKSFEWPGIVWDWCQFIFSCYFC